MALINCPECNKEISDMAESCPHCGFPIAKKAPLKPALPSMLWDSEEDG
jgi:predicted amidophosphoribosyltransferase